MTEKIIGYVVVPIQMNLKLTDSNGLVTKIYRGLDRQPWECVDDIFYNKNLPEDLVSIRKNSRKNYIGNYSPGTLESVDEAFRLLQACKNEKKEAEVIGIIHLGRLGDSDVNMDNSNFLGIDCYVDGYGSLLTLGIFLNPDVFQDYHSSLNKFGLFQNVEMLIQYAKAYIERTQSANLEPIDDLSKAHAYAILTVEQKTRL